MDLIGGLNEEETKKVLYLPVKVFSDKKNKKDNKEYYNNLPRLELSVDIFI